MEKSLDFERKLKKLLKTPMTEKDKEGLEFVPMDKKCTWVNAMCLSLAGKAARGDIQAIKFISEICAKSTDHSEGAVAITVRVVE